MSLEATTHPEVGRIFISYDGSTGLTLGRAIRDALQSNDVESWLWEEDHPDEYPWAEFARQIRAADYICWVCTEGTNNSEGQQWEIENAFGQGKLRRAWVVCTNRGHVPIVFAGYYQYLISVETAHEVVTRWVSRRRTGSIDLRVPLVKEVVADGTPAERASGLPELKEITDVAE